MRALVQGLPVRDMWERYLQAEGASGDLRVVRSTIHWMRDAFAAAARREDRFGTARLVLIDVSRLPEVAVKLPTLDAFAAARGLEEFSQAEQIEAYETAYGRASQRQSRRARLVQRQLDALRWLETLVAQPPRAGDAVAAWLNPPIAAKLEAADIFTVAQLVERINGVGRRWAASIKGVGEGKAARVLQWLKDNEATIGVGVGAHVALRRSALYRHELQRLVPAATDVRPLEKLVVPAELDGSRGAFRRPQAHCLLAASNDYQALLVWLRSKQGVTPEQRQAAQRAPARARRGARWHGRGAGVAASAVAHAARVPQGGRALPAVGRGPERQTAVVDDDRGLHRVPGVLERPAAAIALVRAEEPRTLVGAVAAVRGASVRRRRSARR